MSVKKKEERRVPLLGGFTLQFLGFSLMIQCVVERSNETLDRERVFGFLQNLHMLSWLQPFLLLLTHLITFQSTISKDYYSYYYTSIHLWEYHCQSTGTQIINFQREINRSFWTLCKSRWETDRRMVCSRKRTSPWHHGIVQVHLSKKNISNFWNMCVYI